MSTNFSIIEGNNLKENRFFILKFLMIWPAIFFTSINLLSYFEFLYQIFGLSLLLIFLPGQLLLNFGIFLLTLFSFGKIYLIIINLIHLPKEGKFECSLKDKDYFFYCMRTTIKEFIVKTYDYFPLPWAKIFPLKFFNLTIPSSAGVLDSYIDTDFIELGEESILGEGAIIFSSLILDDTLLIKKTVIQDRATIGAYSIVAPGTYVEEGSILGMGSYTQINQILEKGWIYVGRPARKLKQIQNTIN
ncbi:MAG: hypothetical protein BAJALOKI3v1_10081 [Promethearchaeota archaeon]|nr:MAG: hypothetical protein BAJALOKI3v1_10081 [Candidatus Lokiarchaeota archaeon]